MPETPIVIQDQEEEAPVSRQQVAETPHADAAWPAPRETSPAPGSDTPGTLPQPPRQEPPVIPTPIPPSIQAAPNAGQTMIIPRGAAKAATPHFIKSGNGQRFALSADRIFVGRDPGSHIRLESADISNQHAVILRRGDEFLLQDTGSTNGTFINGERIKGRQPLKDGDVVRFGNAELTFHAH
jgi:pSer/pThr/pTyr-binding forkhead associated (FHA) protein